MRKDLRDTKFINCLGDPKPGFYKVSVAKNAPPVGVLIFYDCPIEMHPEYWQALDRGWGPLRALRNGIEIDWWKVWKPFTIKASRAEYEYLIADRAWAKDYAPDSPEAQPYKAIVTTRTQKNGGPPKPEINICDIPVSNLMP